MNYCINYHKAKRLFIVLLLCSIPSMALAGPDDKAQSAKKIEKSETVSRTTATNASTTSSAVIPVDINTKCYAKTTAAIACICTASPPISKDKCFGCGGTIVEDSYTLHCR